ncbi:hypothetical protein IV203_020772 [Nitzschia inconspicua]|uniref:Uncharacterized protein n=1 Tax=Nitzschia inconspicua TaxID=303405 RepID=A0A9K3KH32_9STRA|nr:hypothetical protein IV203_020772 [Nitzschia inconspicua]
MEASSPQVLSQSDSRNDAATSSSSAYASASSQGAIATSIARLKEINVNFLALDFDRTILSCHTGGRWKGTVDELLEYVRPVFIQLIPAAQAAGIEVAVVTFTHQISLVRAVLDSIMLSAREDGDNDYINNNNNNNNATATRTPSGRIPIRGNDRSWTYNGKGSRSGKQAHMASAVEELEYRFGVKITKATTLLIDDDSRNIRTALQHGVRALRFNPEKPHRLLPEIIKLN